MQQTIRGNENKDEDIRQIPIWTRRFAQNRRAILVMALLLIFFALYGTIAGFSHLASVAHHAILAYFFLALAMLACMVTVAGSIFLAVFLSVPKWGGKQVDRLFERLSKSDGVTVLSPPTATKSRNRKLGMAVAGVYVLCIQAQVFLGRYGYIPEGYALPISAIYVVPFLLFLAIKLRSVAGVIPFLWPFLYGLHAILILSGAPILFTGKWTGLNMLLPTAGYGILTSLIGYSYSRYALRRLKNAARIEVTPGSGEVGAGNDKES